MLVGDGDNRIIASGDRDAIFRMIREMSDRGKRCPGYFYCGGTHLPWNLPPRGNRSTSKPLMP